jgi:hypothetical protein
LPSNEIGEKSGSEEYNYSCVVNKASIMAESVRYTYGDIRPHLKTGDIILFRCNVYSDSLSELGYALRTQLLGTKFGHAGVVFKYGDSIYMLEMVSSDHPSNDKAVFLNGKTSGLRVALLDNVMYDYSKDCDGDYGVKFIENPVSNSCIIENVPKYSEKTFSGYGLIGGIALLDIIVGEAKAASLAKDHPKKMFCTQFVYSILSDCGVLKGSDPSVFWPQKFNDDNFPEFASVTYSETVEFQYK